MARYMPRSQTAEVLAQKEVIAIQLLQRGLSVSQVSAQLRCSPFFVRKIRQALTSNPPAA